MHIRCSQLKASFLTNGIPQSVTNEWDLWSERIQKVPADAVDPAVPFTSFMTPNDRAKRYNKSTIQN